MNAEEFIAAATIRNIVWNLIYGLTLEKAKSLFPNEQIKAAEEIIKQVLNGKKQFRCTRFFRADIDVLAVAVITYQIDWAVYIGGCGGGKITEESIEEVAAYGCKLSEETARSIFGYIASEFPYRQ